MFDWIFSLAGYGSQAANVVPRTSYIKWGLDMASEVGRRGRQRELAQLCETMGRSDAVNFMIQKAAYAAKAVGA